MWRNASSLLLVLLMVVMGHFIFSFFFIIYVIFTIIGTRRGMAAARERGLLVSDGTGSRPHPELVAVLAWPHRGPVLREALDRLAYATSASRGNDATGPWLSFLAEPPGAAFARAIRHAVAKDYVPRSAIGDNRCTGEIPTDEPHDPHRRDHPDAPRHRRPGLLPAQKSRREEALGSAQVSQAQDLRRDLPPAARRHCLGNRCGSGRALRGVSRIQRGRLAPAHRHFGSATSRTRRNDATPGTPSPEDLDATSPQGDRLTTEGSRSDATRPGHRHVRAD